MSYMTLSSQEKHLFLLCSYFRAHPTTLLLQILGGRMHGPSPSQILGGPSPSPLWVSPSDWGTDAWAVVHLKFFEGTVSQSLLSLRPCCQCTNSYACLHTDTGLYERF